MPGDEIERSRPDELKDELGDEPPEERPVWSTRDDASGLSGAVVL